MFRDDRYIRNSLELEIPAHLNFGKYVLDRIRVQPKANVALINGKDDTKLTYGELTQYAVDLATSLAALGVGRGDVVAVCTESRNEFMPIVIGIMLAGATYIPFEPRIGRVNLKHNIQLTKPKHLFLSQIFWDIYRDVLEDIKFKTCVLIDDMDLDSAISIKKLISKNYNVDQFEPRHIEGQNDLAVILYSSGSTAYPKPIMITHHTCICNSLIGSFKDPVLRISICHGKWCMSYENLMTFKFLAIGRTIVYFGGSKDIFFKCVQNYKPNIGFLYPTFVYDLATDEGFPKHNLESLQYVYCGTSAIDDDIKNKLMERMPGLKTFARGYGMTETFELTSENWGVPGLKPNSVGKPGPGITLKVVDLSTREPVGPNEYGELCVDVHNIFKGYIGTEPSTYLDNEGFLKTGDLGYYDEDGYFFIVDRLKEIMFYDGYKVSPVAVETLIKKYPGVKDAGVAGKPVSEYRQDPTAFIVKEPGSNITEKEIIDYVRREATSHVILRGGVRFVDKIPRNSIGKIIRTELKKLLNA